MPNLLTIILLAEGFNAALISQQMAGVLDLVGLAVGIWTVWSSISLPFGGNLQRAFRLISFGALAFAISHLIDSLVGGLQLLSEEQGLLLMQGTALLSMLFFVPGLAGLADLLPTLSSARRLAPFPRFWPLAVTVVIIIGTFSFILYGISPEAETVALIGLEVSITIITGLSVILLLRARIGGVIGRSLWLAMLGLLLFSLAHPLQAWLYNETGLPGATLDVLHRLIVMPSLLLFALSITRLARKLSASLYIESAHTTMLPTAKLIEPEEYERWKAMDSISPRARAQQSIERKRAMTGPLTPRPFPALQHTSEKDV